VGADSTKSARDKDVLILIQHFQNYLLLMKLRDMLYKRLNEIIGIFTCHKSVKNIVLKDKIIHQYLNKVLFAEFC
jgi:hypothetical protein